MISTPAGQTRPRRQLDVTGPVVLRIAGLSSNVLDALSDEALLGTAQHKVEVERKLATISASLADELRDVIGAEQRSSQARVALIRLRRDVYNARPSRDLHRVLAEGDLAPRLESQLRRWQDCLDHRRATQDRGDALASAERDRIRDRLRAIADDDWFLAGLTLASPDFSDDLLPWIYAPVAPIAPRIERTLHRYLTRAAAKTSPFSTFMISALGEWCTDGPLVQVEPTVQPTLTVELNVAILDHVRRVLATWPEGRGHLVLRTSPALELHDARIRLLRRAVGGPEQLVSINIRTGWIHDLLDAAQDGTVETAAGAVAWLAAAPHGPRHPEAALGSLLDLGVLELVERRPSQCRPTPAYLLAGLGVSAAAGERVGALREAVADLTRATAALPSSGDAVTRRARQRDIDRAAARTAAAAGRAAPSMPGPRRHAIYEDAGLPGRPVVFGRRAWSPIIDALTAVAAIAPLYDWSLPIRREAAHAFVELFGSAAEVGFLDFYGAVHGNERATARLRMILELLRAHPATIVADEITRLHQHVGGEVLRAPVHDATRTVSPQLVADLAAQLPAWVPSTRSLTFLGQLRTGDGPAGFVLNSIEGGHGRVAGRAARRTATDLGMARHGGITDDAVLAELPGCMGTNVNLRGGTAPYAIVQPGDVASPEAVAIRVAELRVIHDPRTDSLALRSARHRLRIVPVHLGDMAEFLLPPASRLLIQVFGDSPVCYLTEGLGGTSLPWTVQLPHRVHRLSIGPVVVQRSAVWLQARQLPQRTPAESDFDYLVRVTRWRNEHDIGVRCFTYQLPSAPTSSDPSSFGRKARKPMYFDLSSLATLDSLAHMARSHESTALFAFEEALPDPSGLTAVWRGRSHVTECAIELSCSPA